MNGSGKQSFYEIQLSNSSLIIAFVIAVGIGVAVFMLGVMVGRGQVPATLDKGVVEEPFSAADPAANPEEQASSDLQFDDSVREPTSSDDGVDEFEAAPAAGTQPADPPPSTTPSIQLPAHDPAIASGFVVQVRATPDRAAADALQAALAGAGFPAFVVSGDNMFRVRVGRYRNQGDAERVAALLDARADIDETWITQG